MAIHAAGAENGGAPLHASDCAGVQRRRARALRGDDARAGAAHGRDAEWRQPAISVRRPRQRAALRIFDPALDERERFERWIDGQNRIRIRGHRTADPLCEARRNGERGANVHPSVGGENASRRRAHRNDRSCVAPRSRNCRTFDAVRVTEKDGVLRRRLGQRRERGNAGQVQFRDGFDPMAAPGGEKRFRWQRELHAQAVQVVCEIRFDRRFARR